MLKIWVPFISAGTGADTLTRSLAAGLRERGCEVIEQPFNSYFEVVPWLLRWVSPPSGTQIILTNTWSGFAFARPKTRMVTIDHLFVLDPTLRPYKSKLQRYYHDTLIRHFVKTSAFRADSVVAVSRYTAGTFARELSRPQPQVILNAVDTEFFTPMPAGKPPLNGRPARLLYVGNLSRRKGSDLLEPIMERLGSGYELHFTGQRALRTSSLPPNMHPLGWLNQHQIREAYRTADLLLFPSRGEGLPCAVMEAMACGTPVVASDISSLPEVVTPNTGQLCPVDDAGAFAAAVREITGNPERLAAMSHAARERAKRVFDLDRMADEYIALFFETLSY